MQILQINRGCQPCCRFYDRKRLRFFARRALEIMRRFVAKVCISCWFGRSFAKAELDRLTVISFDARLLRNSLKLDSSCLTMR
jgi:hypothetical protein